VLEIEENATILDEDELSGSQRIQQDLQPYKIISKQMMKVLMYSSKVCT